MPPRPKNGWRRTIGDPSPITITALYVVLAAVWIVISDMLLDDLDFASPFVLSVTKGLAFVVVTGTVLYLLLRQRDRALARQSEQLRFQANLLDEVQNAVIATDMDGVVRHWNRAAERMYGWTADEAIGRPVTELTVPASGKLAAEKIMEQIAETGSWQDEFEVTRKDGTTFPALVSNVLYHDAAGRPAGLVGVSTDLTRLHEAEREATRAGKRARAILDSVTFPVAVISDDGEIIDVNQAWTTFALKNDGDLDKTGVGNDYLAPIRRAIPGEPQLAEVVAGINDVLEGDAPLFTHRYPCHAPDRPRWFEMQVTPIDDTGAVIAHVDLTTEVLAQRTLENAVEEKDQFLATVSHELRTPLTAVLGFAEQLRAGLAEPDDLQAYYDTIADQAREVADLVEDLLLAGRLDTDTITIRPEIVTPAELVASVIRPWTPSRDITVTVGSGVQPVRADPLRARQILRNLVTNAIRHGSEPYLIEIEHHSGVVRFHVVDHGPGVPEEVSDHIWDPYTEASARHGQPGSVGLGLYVSHRLADLMGGSLSHVRRGGATVFTLALPESSD